MATPNRRELLEKAWDTEEAGDDTEEQELSGELGAEGEESPEGAEGGAPEGEQPEGEGEQTPEQIAAAEAAAKAKEPKVKWTGDPAKDPAKKGAKKADPYAQERKAGAQGQQQAPTDKPPNSWKPEVRQHWGAIPPEARAEISRRELQIQQTLSSTDGLRRWSNDMANVIAPHADLIRAQNSTPLQAISNLMETASRLMRGSAVQRAQVISEIIQNYGVDFATLDQVLSQTVNPNGQRPNGQGAPQVGVDLNPNAAPPAWAAPMFNFMNRMENATNQQQQQLRETAEQAVIEAADKYPYFEDLREDVADLMEMAFKRGQKVTMDQAYLKALQIRPDIAKLVPLDQRPKIGGGGNGLRVRSNVSAAASTLAKARRAASTVSGAPSGGGDGKGAPKSRREALEAAWDDTSA